MKSAPNFDALYICTSTMAKSMHMRPLPLEQCNELLAHVLYTECLQGVEGKNAWESYCMGLITEIEIRNLLMAHCATKISFFNRLSEPDARTYLSRNLSEKFEIALFARPAQRLNSDVVDF